MQKFLISMPKYYNETREDATLNCIEKELVDLGGSRYF